jgi:nucleotidyltransferase substrate binding protein (TIGR01987 family)
MNNQDIRWEQRFSNYNKALNKLEKAIQYIENDFADNPEDRKNLGNILNDLIQQGLIQSFEYTHELAWNVIKDYAIYQGNMEISGSRDAAREAFAMGLISDGEVWMEMINSRNKTSHTYDEETANEIFTKILDEYFPAFIQFRNKMEEIRNGKQGSIFEEQ